MIELYDASPAATSDAELGAGAWLHNPATGELAQIRVGPRETAGRRIEVDLWLQPGAAVSRPHVHPAIDEHFEVLDGEVGFKVGRQERAVRPGAGVLEVPAGTPHDWWNAGEGVAHVRAEARAAAGAPGRPAARFVAMIEALWSLGALGQVDASGTPDPLWLAAIGSEYRDVMRFLAPPAPVQAVLLGPVAALARRTGRDPRAAHLHGPAAACVIADPGEEGRAALLERPVGARAARGRG